MWVANDFKLSFNAFNEYSTLSNDCDSNPEMEYIMNLDNISKSDTAKKQPVKNLPNMVFVEGGTFEMRNKEGESDEKTVHQVTVDDFYTVKYEITTVEFVEFLNARNNKEEDSVNWINTDGTYDGEKCHVQKVGDKFVVENGCENHPVTFVN
jgi:formylglycine-generating enzyme required for sulfatase activity